ncbi:MAG: hypothetical protein IKE92_04905 [Clostridiales bacterium]|nr:hypothetical protein [Clostridiales bacterium]
MFCGNCGKPLESGAFCPYCGAKRPDVSPAPAAETVAETVSQPEAENVNQPAAETVSQPEVETVNQPVPEPIVAPEPAAETPATVAENTPEPENVPEPAPSRPGAVSASEAAPAAAVTPEVKPKKKKSAKPFIIIGAVVLGLILIAGGIVAFLFFSIDSKYKKGMEAIDNEDYSEAIDTFNEIKTYKDSEYWAEYAQIELDYQALGDLDAAGDYDGIIALLNERSKFFGNDKKGKEAKALSDEYATLKAAFADKEAEKYFDAADKFDSLTQFEDKYAYEAALCRVYGYEDEQDWISAIAYLYGIQIQDFDLAYIDKPLGSEQSLISKDFIAQNNYVSDPQAFDDALNLNSVEEKALAEIAVNGLWYNYAYNKWMNNEWEEAIDIFTRLGDFRDSAYVLNRVKDDLDGYTTSYNEAMAYYENGEYYKAKKLFDSIPEFKDSVEMAESCKQPLPETDDYRYDDGSIQLDIYAPSGSKSVLIRLYDSDGDVVAQVFISAGDYTTLYVGAETYTIKVAYGTEWYGETDLFGDRGSYTQLYNGDDPDFTFSYGYKYTLELMTVEGGNVGSDSLSGADDM